MKKKVLSVLLVAAMTASMVAGCGDTNEPANNGGNDTQAGAVTPDDNGDSNTDDAIANLIAATEGTVDLTLWCSDTTEYQAVMAELVESFKAQYPDVDFNIEIGAVSEADCKSRVLEDVEAAADVYAFADDQLTELVKAGALQPVQATYTYDPGATNAPSTIAAASKDGQLYAYPMTASNGYFLYYNSEYLSKEDVSSWENLMAKAETIDGAKVGYDLGNAWYVYGWFAGADLELSMNEDQSNNCNWNNEVGVEVAKTISEVAGSDAFISIGDKDAKAQLAAGTNIIAYVDGAWDSNAFEEFYGDGYAATKLPTFNAGGNTYQMASYAGYKFLGVNAFSKQIGWSMLLAEYLTNEDSQAKIAEATGEGPANLVAASEISNPALSALAEQSDFADQQIVGGNYWSPAASLGASLAESDESTDFQKLLDDAVAGITQPVQ